MDDNDAIRWVSTCWPKVGSGKGEGDAARKARGELLVRYHEVVYEYFKRKLRDPDAAGELYSIFAIRFLDSNRLIKNCDPSVGRFRCYLSRCLSNMVADYYNGRARLPAQMPAEPDVAAPASDPFPAVWVQELLNHAWRALGQHESRTGQLSFTVLRYVTDHEALRSAQLAEHFTRQLNKSFTAESMRQIVHRARQRFATLLLKEIERSLGNATLDELEAEVRELQLVSYCADALKERRGAG